jgi:transposase
MSTAERLEASGEVLSPEVRAALDERDALALKLAAVEERLRELEARLGQNSKNSSRPPSSDPPGVVREKKKPSGCKRGGQRGHKGHHRVLLPPERVDEVVVHRPEACRHCGESLAGAKEVKPARRHQVVELPVVRAEVTEHRMVCVRCPGCRKLTRGSLPAGVRGKSFGPRLTARAGMLIGRFRQSRREVREVLATMLDVPPPSLGSTQAIAREVSAALEASYTEVREAVRRSESARVDETGWKLSGRRHWLWTAESDRGTVFHLGPSRGSRELVEMLGEGYGGIVTSDRWSAYRIYERRQLCWAHLQRNLEGLGLQGPEAARFARVGLALCDRLFETMRQVREGRLPREALRTRMARHRVRFSWLLRCGVKSGHRKVVAFASQLQALESALWTFLEHPIEPTNNAAERALRKAVLWRKGSFGSQSEDGLRFVERMLTLTETCRQFGLHPLHFLCEALSAHRAGTPSPKLLPTG